MTTVINDVESKKVLCSVPEAENLIVTNDNRWFVSGGDGFYQIDPNGVTQPQKIPLAFDSSSAPSTDNRSFFFGITQYKHFIYASCTPNPKDPASPRYIMFMDMMRSPASMTAIHQISDAVFFNGLGSDAIGNLYLAYGGKFIPPTSGKLVKLSMSSLTTVASQSDWLDADGRPNGIKINGDTLYFSQEPTLLVGNSHVKKVRIKADGTPDTPATLYTAGIGKLLDDIELVDGGLVVTQAGFIDSIDPATFHNSRFNKIIHISESGQEFHSSHIPLSPPSAVKLVPDSTSRSPDLIITERTGEVSLLSQMWGLKPRAGVNAT